MTTLLQRIDQFIDKITVSDRQEDNISASVSNLTSHLTNKDNNLHVHEVFTNGSYERDTIITPLDDIDLFAVLKEEEWKDESGNLPKPQAVLTKFRDYLNGQNDYKGKVKQDRPCVTIKLSDKDFDVLPSFEQTGGGYLIPNYDLTGWTYSYPQQLADQLDKANRTNKYKLKPLIRAVKYWNRENDKLIPSFHIEEAAINIFQINSFTNYEEAVRVWFNNAEYNLSSTKFKSPQDYTSAVNKIKKIKEKLNNAKKLYDGSKEGEAIKIWKEIFNGAFSAVDINEAKNFSKSLTEGTLKIGSTGVLSTTVGKSIPASKGFYGEEQN